MDENISGNKRLSDDTTQDQNTEYWKTTATNTSTPDNLGSSSSTSYSSSSSSSSAPPPTVPIVTKPPTTPSAAHSLETLTALVQTLAGTVSNIQKFQHGPPMPGQRTTTPTRNRKTTPQAKERTSGNPTQQNPIPIRRPTPPIVNATVQQPTTAPMPQYQYLMQPMYQTYGHGPINHTPHNMIHPMHYNPPYPYPGPQYQDTTHTMRPLPPYG